MGAWTDFKFPQRRRVLRQRIRLAVIGIVTVSNLVASVLIEESAYYAAIVPTLILAVAAIAEFVAGESLVDKLLPDTTEATFKRLDDMASSGSKNFITAIQDKLKSSVHRLRGQSTASIRSTIHLVIDVLPAEGLPDARALVQLTEYVNESGVQPSPGPRPARGRLLSVAQGIVGRCVRSMAIEAVNFATEDEYRQRMVGEFGFTRGAAAAHTMSARSYYAIPILDGAKEKVLGVVYFDSSEPQVFPAVASRLDPWDLAADIRGYLTSAGILSG